MVDPVASSACLVLRRVCELDRCGSHVWIVCGARSRHSAQTRGFAIGMIAGENQALLQVVVVEARPRWLHVGPPCTFWCTISRWTAHATRERWDDNRKSARTHRSFALHLLSLQEARGDNCSIEQPPGCASWKLGMTQYFRQAYLAWT